MDAKEVKTHVATLEKAVRDRLPATAVKDVLASLQRGVVATETLLRETRVGMAVNKLRTHADATVVELAKDIVAQWKKDVHQKAKPSSGTSSVKSKSPAGSSPAASTPMSPPGAGGSSMGGSGASRVKVDPANRNRKSDGANCDVTGDKGRNNCVGVLYDGLCLDSDVDPARIVKLATAIESHIFTNHKQKLDASYKRRVQALYLALKDKKNPKLRRRVVSGEISAERFAVMESKDMASEERKAEDALLQKENMRSAQVAKAEKSVTDQFKCGKCGQRKVSYTQAQTRSADEPMTTFCTCEVCGNRWKFS